MKQIIILILLTIPLGCRSQNWEWISNQIDVENNADPNKTVVQMTAVYDYHKMEMEAKMMTDKMKKQNGGLPLS